MKNGWIKLYRKIIDSVVFRNEKCLKIWIWCLSRAGHQENCILLGREKITLKQGQFVMGLNKSSEVLDLAKTTIKYWLDFLEKEDKVELKKTTKYTIITIRNWDNFQEVEHKRNTNGTQKETNKNDKNDKNISSAKAEIEYVPLKEDKHGSVWDSDKYIDKLINAQREDLKIVGHYMKIKKLNFPTQKAAKAEFGRQIKSAVELADYPKNKRTLAVQLAAKSTPQWTLLTVCKFINK